MSDDRLISEGLIDLSAVVVDDSTILDALRGVAAAAVETINSAASVGLTMLIDGDLRTGVSTDAAMATIDRSQYDSGEGPGLDAVRTGEIRRIASTIEDGPWPAFRAACRAHGIMSTASFPMVIDGERYGALNIYSSDYHGFGANEIRIGRSIADRAALVIADAMARLPGSAAT